MKKYVFGCIASLMLSFNIGFSAENIHTVSRELGSGTRSAFADIFGIHKMHKGKKIDATTKKAEITNQTGVMIKTIANSKNAIGYISLGALNDEVKALSIDSVMPSVANIKNGSYKIFRPFHIVIKNTNPLVEDFLSYSISAKDIIEKSGYISQTENNSFVSKKPQGKLIIAGSSSIAPLMEKLTQSYKEVNPNALLEIQISDSTTGINLVVDGVANIGMASRDIKEHELQKGIIKHVLALDGLAIIVNKSNPITDLSKDEIYKIFTGEITTWDMKVKK